MFFGQTVGNLRQEDIVNNELNIPRRIKVATVIRSRYEPGERPVQWGDREAGEEEIQTDSGERIFLWSSGGQSSPAPGWELLLTEAHRSGTTDQPDLYGWTLYGIASSDSETGAKIKPRADSRS